MTAVTETLVDLLGDTRGRIVELLHERPRSVSGLADELGVSEVAVRRHLQVLEREDLVEARKVRRSGPGRPGSRYELKERAKRLFPDHSAEFANELLEYVAEEHGREAVRAFLRWRAERQQARYARILAEAGSDTRARTVRLADLLSDDGFPSTVDTVTRPDGGTALQLTQGHCAIRQVAEEHPEICAVEARMFEDLLGVGVSRRQTAAGGAGQCVCDIAVGTDGRDTGTDGADHARRRTGARDGDEG
jgi:predicted ArsR family transcriptional regulator